MALLRFRWWWIVLFIIVILNLFLLKNYFGFALVNEDWQYLVAYKIVNLNPILKFFYFWREVGPRGGYYIFYLGLIDQFFPNNYELIHVLNFFWKILATLSLFPVVWVFTKDRVLALLSAVFFGIAFSASGLLTYASTGVEYIGIIFMNLLIVSYFYFYKTRKIKYFLISYLLLYSSLLTAYLRCFPVFVIIVAFEILMIVNKRNSIKNSLVRIFIILIPLSVVFLGISRQISTATHGSLYDLTGAFKILSLGNWYHFISPFSGLGFQFVSAKYAQFFGTWDLVHFGSFVGYIFPKIFVALFILSLFSIRLISPKKKKYFFLLLGLQILFILFLFGLITSFRFIFHGVVSNYDSGSQLVAFFAAIVGSFVLSVSLISGLVWWREERKNYSLLVMFLSPILSFIFILFPWIYIGMHFTFEGGIHRYLAVPAIGISIFLAALVTLAIKSRNRWKILDYAFVFLIVFYFFATSKSELGYYFGSLKYLGLEVHAEQSIQDQFYNVFIKDKGDLLVYFQPDGKPDTNTLFWQRALEFEHLPDWSYLRKYYQLKPDEVVKDCVAIVPDYERLEKSVSKSKGKLDFSLAALCREDLNKNLSGNYVGITNRTFTESQFLAFTIKEGRIINITSDIIRKLKGRI